MPRGGKKRFRKIHFPNVTILGKPSKLLVKEGTAEKPWLGFPVRLKKSTDPPIKLLPPLGAALRQTFVIHAKKIAAPETGIGGENPWCVDHQASRQISVNFPRVPVQLANTPMTKGESPLPLLCRSDTAEKQKGSAKGALGIDIIDLLIGVRSQANGQTIRSVYGIKTNFGRGTLIRILLHTMKTILP